MTFVTTNTPLFHWNATLRSRPLLMTSMTSTAPLFHYANSIFHCQDIRPIVILTNQNHETHKCVTTATNKFKNHLRTFPRSKYIYVYQILGFLMSQFLTYSRSFVCQIRTIITRILNFEKRELGRCVQKQLYPAILFTQGTYYVQSARVFL